MWCYYVSFDRVCLCSIRSQFCVVAKWWWKWKWWPFIQTKAIYMVATSLSHVLIQFCLWQNQQAIIIAMQKQEKTVTITAKFHEIRLNTKPFVGAVYYEFSTVESKKPLISRLNLSCRRGPTNSPFPTLLKASSTNYQVLSGYYRGIMVLDRRINSWLISVTTNIKNFVNFYCRSVQSTGLIPF